ncbi:MAG: hypothetical protein ACUVV6_00575 [Thermoplasmatota archaeon]
MSRRDELLDKALAGHLTQEEARELKELIEREDSVRELDRRIRMLIAFGVGAAAGYALPRLLELGEGSAPEEPEEGGAKAAPRKK